VNAPGEFSFGNRSVATAYDTVLVPILFDPWAAQLVDNFQPWRDQCVLDLATGTGVVANRLSQVVGPADKVIGVDINAEMLNLARQRCTDAVQFIESPAHPLAQPAETVDVVVCQQGFQFFPDKPAAALELSRVLRAGGRVIVTTWRPVAECEWFGKICDALESIGETSISDSMRVPFDFMPESDLSRHFEAAGFQDVRIRQQELDLTFDGGVAQAVEATYATPIGPKLRALTPESQRDFRETLAALLDELSTDGKKMGRMVSNVLSAVKPSSS